MEKLCNRRITTTYQKKKSTYVKSCITDTQKFSHQSQLQEHSPLKPFVPLTPVSNSQTTEYIKEYTQA